MSITIEQELRLEDACWQCRGEGEMFWPKDGKTRPCDICHGVGYFPTEAGQQLIAFLQHHWQQLTPSASAIIASLNADR